MEVRDEVTKNVAYIKRFGSLDEFYRYITNEPVNKAFAGRQLDSDWIGEKAEKFSGTKSFEEACDLLRNGWDKETLELKAKLDLEEHKEPQMTYKNIQSVQGYHPIVPLYLMGVPNNMITKKMVPLKHKIITIDKVIGYGFSVTKEQIVNEAVKVVRIINKLERQNYRINLNIVCLSKSRNTTVGIKIKLKSANESLNISKLTYPLVHPSMLRRLYLRFVEVYPHSTKYFTQGYGAPLSAQRIKELFVKDGTYKDDYILPQFITKDIDKINDIKDLENL